MLTPEISVLCPTRHRPELLRRSWESLLVMADDPSRIEFLAAVDPDDTGLEAQSWTGPAFHIWTAPERYGYKRLHEYANALARQARGKWVLMWNDDAVMRTHGWDTVITGCQVTRLLWLEANHHCTGNLFPAWPRAWTDLMGHVSLSPNVDRWLSEIARSQGLEVRVPVLVYHERADITGLNRDQTYLEGRHLMGAGVDDSEFASEENMRARALDARKIANLVYGEVAETDSSR